MGSQRAEPGPQDHGALCHQRHSCLHREVPASPDGGPTWLPEKLLKMQVLGSCLNDTDSGGLG